MKTFAIRLRQNAKYFFRGQEDSAQRRSAGTVIADASLENAAYYIAQGVADLYVGPKPRRVEYMDPNNSNSNYQRAITRKMETDFIIRCGLAAQAKPPQK